MIQDEICAAIGAKRVVEFRYKLAVRRVEPHTLGYDDKGTLVLCAWSLTSIPAGFRDFHVTKLSALSTTGQTFAGPRPGYNQNDSTMARILCRL